MYLVSSGFSFKPTSSSSIILSHRPSSAKNEWWVCKRVVVNIQQIQKHAHMGIKSFARTPGASDLIAM